MSAHGGDATLLVLAVSILVGGLAIHVGSVLALTGEDYEHALVTAVLGGLAWALVDYAFAEAGLPGRLSSVVGLVVWVAVIGWRYDAGWIRAAMVGLFGWIAALATLAVLDVLGIGGLGAYGIPGV